MGESIFEYTDKDGVELQVYHFKLYDEYFIRVGELIVEVEHTVLSELRDVLTKLTDTIL